MAGINEYPLEYRRVIYKRIEAATGESAEKIKKAYFKKLEKILERGVIKDREEYELVHSRIDELVHNTPEDAPARKDLPELERIFMNLPLENSQIESPVILRAIFYIDMIIFWFLYLFLYKKSH